MVNAFYVLNLNSYNYEFRNLNIKNVSLFNEIFDLLHQIEATGFNNYRLLWLNVKRGNVLDGGFSDVEDACEYFNVENEADLQAAYEKSFTEEEYWFDLESVEDNGHRVLSFYDLNLVSNDNYPEYSEYEKDHTPILELIKYHLECIIEELKAGTYNDRVNANLPYDLRYGIIRRDEYWKHKPHDKEYALKDLTDAEIQEFISIAEQQKVPNNPINNMTFNKYFEMASVAFHATGLSVDDLSLYQQFKSFGEDFGGRVLESLSHNSVEDFMKFYSEEHCFGGHPWGIRRGSSRTRVMLFPEHTETGFYFKLSGNPYWNAYELVKTFLALKKENYPVVFSYPSEIISYLKEDDYIGIVSKYVLPIYCQLSFSQKHIDDFRHFNTEEDMDIFNLIEWQPIHQATLKGESKNDKQRIFC